MDHSRQNLVRQCARLLSSVFLLFAMFAVSPRPTLAQTPPAPVEPKQPKEKFMEVSFKRQQLVFALDFNVGLGFGNLFPRPRYLGPSIGFSYDIITPRIAKVAVSLDFEARFRKQNGESRTTISGLGGVTVFPFNGAQTTNKATVSLHALGGISHLKADNNITVFTENSFYLKLGGALDLNVTEKFFVRPLKLDYAPTFFGGATQHNAQVGFGVGVRF